MTARRIGLATLFAALAAPAAAQAAATFVQEGLPYATGAAPYGVIARDFNGDGLPDVATINGTASNLSVYLRQPTGGFTQQANSPFATGGGADFGDTADFNADGLPDIAVANYVDSTVSLLLGQGGGTFASGGTLGVSARTLSVASGDFNGDGRPDLAATTENGLVTIFLRTAAGGFTSTTYGANPGPRNLSVGDLDGDGDQDLAIANESAGGVTVLLNNGAGAFSDGGFTVTGTTTADTAIADFNGDGRADIAASNAGSSTVSVLLRNAQNTGFDAPVSTPVPAGPLGLVAGDFDANGRADVAVASNTAGTVTILSGGTSAETPIAVTRAYGIAAADFNRDGKTDLAVSGDTQDTFSVLLNTTPSSQPPAPTPTPTPPAPTPTPVATPVAGKSVNAIPVSGKVKVKLKGSNKFVDLAEAKNVPVGSTVDATDGRVTIVAAKQGGQADFYDGIFKISQSAKGSKPLTTLTLTEPLSCPKAKKSAITSAAKKKTRKLWGEGKGAFRTSGKYSAATVRGTKWLVQDYCDRTVTKVKQGVVSVRDNVKHRTITVRKGKSYTARAKKR